MGIFQPELHGRLAGKAVMSCCGLSTSWKPEPVWEFQWQFLFFFKCLFSFLFEQLKLGQANAGIWKSIRVFPLCGRDQRARVVACCLVGALTQSWIGHGVQPSSRVCNTASGHYKWGLATLGHNACPLRV